MKVALASDHRGFKLKNILGDFLKEKGYNVVDFGTHTSDPCDYPDMVWPACLAVKNKKAERGLLICYTGIGSCIAANKVKGIRAALVHNLKSAILSRKHNNSNVLVLPAYLVTSKEAKRIVSKWLKEEFEAGRHLNRLKKVKEIEEAEFV
ncbi:MAG: ribose 5-phosphate isomerase B [Candidatus Omnitrophica bacterium]|nr:ribose 5-phosphate isomerase B [Candidatus Omnitrophota bacterium]MBU1134640.1 ribose 5-phosphate isomerase B [Candidatus Omnitrophota bacterium]MBU1367038.1 ribose 5-phosphate isomerase B [Candidatus Omnitrophota bacterium]MBU1523655.1 ribose 5-phosphate isomerase B [Candidatus Omnitrophota bacterium]MBU1811273.1 ribose 5-phosphate isomerase B [Candidatus Omnitrophota bacterium]